MAQAFLSSGFVGGRPARLGSETFTANGTYNANDFNNAKGKPLDGFSQITINTPYEAILDGSVETIDTSVTTLRASAFANMTNLAKLVLRNASSLLSTIQNALPTTLSQGAELNIYVPSSSLDDYTALYGSVYTVNDISTYGRYWFTPTTSETTLTSDMYVSGITAYLTSDDPYDGLSIPSTITALGSGSLTPITSPTSTLGIYDLRFEGDITAFGTFFLTNIDSNFASANCPITKFRYGGSSLNSAFLVNAISLKEYYLNGNPTNVGFYNVVGNLKIEYISAPDFTGTIAEIGFYGVYNDYLAKISFPKATVLGYRAFCYCRKISSVYLPNVISMNGGNQFDTCSSLVSVSMPKVTNIDTRCFANCAALAVADFPAVTSTIASGAFHDCGSLRKLKLEGASVPALLDTDQVILGVYFLYSNIPTAWVATNWSSFTAKMVGVLTTATTQTLDSTLDISGTSHNVTWYSDEDLTTVVSGSQPAGTYYAKVA